jgi:hypothetical protein
LRLRAKTKDLKDFVMTQFSSHAISLINNRIIAGAFILAAAAVLAGCNQNDVGKKESQVSTAGSGSKSLESLSATACSIDLPPEHRLVRAAAEIISRGSPSQEQIVTRQGKAVTIPAEASDRIEKAMAKIQTNQPISMPPCSKKDEAAFEVSADAAMQALQGAPETEALALVGLEVSHPCIRGAVYKIKVDNGVVYWALVDQQWNIVCTGTGSPNNSRSWTFVPGV